MDSPAPPPRDVDGRVTADVVIIGAGVAGLFAAVNLPRNLSVVVIDKGTAGKSGSSPWAQGGMAVALGPDDSPETHALDTEAAGDGLCDPAAVRVLTNEAPQRMAELVTLGARFDVRDGVQPAVDLSHLHLAREGGQRVARSVHRADATGREMVRALRAAARDRVSRLAGTAVQLIRSGPGRVAGVWVLTDDGLVPVLAPAVLLATGGCGGLFAATTNQDTATADGVALAYAAGAAVRDLEFVQFHPTGLATSGAWRFLLTEALRGAGATLHAADGTRFMLAAHPDAELAPRHVVSKAILAQEGGRAWLDATHLGEQRLEEEFPTVLEGVRTHGFDLASERVPVTPAAHYMVGGVRTDLEGRTALTGLYAAGEVASTGVHGANRMAGNSLAEALVFGGRAAEAIAAALPTTPRPGHEGEPPSISGAALTAFDQERLRARLRETMWRHTGPVRTRASLLKATADLVAIERELGVPSHDPAEWELRMATLSSRLITNAAALRPESRGGHFRDDHPSRDPGWVVHLEHVRPA